MPKRYCIRGHDTEIVGRVQRMCRECRRLGDRARYQRRQTKARRYWHSIGWLKALNRRVDQAIRSMEVRLGGHR